MPRPVSVTVILWVSVAVTLEGLVGLIGPFANVILTTIAAKHDSTVPFLLWSGAGGAVAQLVLALLMLRGIAWARVVYVCVLAFVILGLLTNGVFPLITAVVITKSAIFIYFLFRPEANRFFAPTHPSGSADNTDAA
jgi:hypothetical protein